MDCEKCEELLLDELYGELDDVTSAAVRRHVAGCAHCSEIFSDLKSTREMVSSMPIIAVPPSLEERIFAAEKESRKVVPLRGVSRFVSVAGRWAMRPQTAMAALFLLMIGSTTFFLKGRNPNHASSIVVAQEGAPMSADQTPASTESLAPNAARGAHGPLEAKPQTTPPPAAVALGAAASAAPTPAATTAVAMDDAEKDKDGDESKNAPTDMRHAAPRKVARSANDPNSNGLDDMTASNAAAPAGAPPQQQAMNVPPPPPPASKSLEQGRGDLGNSGYYSQQPGATGATGGGGVALKKEDNSGAGDAFAQGKSAYQNGQYPAATQSFDRAAQGGDVNASLWSARATRQGQGCQMAIPKFDAVTARVGVSGLGADAMNESAQCSAQLGQVDVARAKYTQLLGVQAYAQTAQQQLSALNQVASRRAVEAQKKAGPSAHAAAAAPQPAAKPVAPAAATDSTK